jgi:hypothetical protein
MASNDDGEDFASALSKVKVAALKAQGILKKKKSGGQ